jgi:flagellar FliL protein
MAEETTEETQEGNSNEKKSSSLVLIIVIVMLILVILVGVVAFILMSGADDESNAQSAPAAQEKQVSQKPRTSADSEVVTPFKEIGLMFPMDTFTVNLLSDSGRRYLKVQMNLEIAGEELAAELDTKKAVIRDIIIRLLSSKSLDEISTAKGKDKLKEQITDQLNLRLRDGHINNVYFTEFVIQ